jgi:hypothetical protein
VAFEQGLAAGDDARKFFMDLWAAGARRRLPPNWRIGIAATIPLCLAVLAIGILLRNPFVWGPAAGLLLALPLIAWGKEDQVLQPDIKRDITVWNAPGFGTDVVVPVGPSEATVVVTYRLGKPSSVRVGLRWLSIPAEIELRRDGRSLVASREGRVVAAVVFREGQGQPRP